MSGRVLFVDDDQMLLSSMERCLGLKFDLETAISGPEALRRIESEAAFPVIVSDMRMPVMDGVQFIERARQLSKHTVFLMLTGNQDVQTAIRAVNEGQVFRFLNKPCDPAEITSAIEQAQRQFRLESAERELLNKTFVGALGIFADVMETLQPDLIGRAGRTEQFLEQLRERCGFDSRWEFKVASKLLLLGFAMQSQSSSLSPTSKRASIDLNRACTTAARMVERIPRMDQVAEIIRCVPATSGEITVLQSEDAIDITQIGATLLRIAHMVEALSHLGVNVDEAETEFRHALPAAYEPLVEAAREIYPTDIEPDGVPVAVEDLVPGMVLHDYLIRSDGATLLRAGRALSATHIDKLRSEYGNYSEDGGIAPVMITRVSFLEACPDAVLPQKA